LLTNNPSKLNTFRYRLILSTVFYSIFALIYLQYGFNLAAFVTLIPSFSFYLYFLYEDNLEILDKGTIFFAVIVVLYGLFISLFLRSDKNPFFNAILIKAGFEEILFRLCMLGILKYYVDFEDNVKMGVVLILNALFFSSLHVQYQDIWGYSTIFLQGLNFGVTYLGLGIVPSIVSHTLWNYYYPNVNPQLPILVAAVARIYYDVDTRRRSERAERIRYLR